MTMTNASDVNYDPYDFEIDTDPHPIWKRLRDEAPLYYNEKHDFFALSRFEDVERGLTDWETFRSGRGSILEIIKANVEIPSGIVLMEDPPIHDIHRGVLSRVFTPKKMQAVEPKVREFCARTLDPFVGATRFDVVADFGAELTMHTIGMLLGIPEQDQRSVREQLDAPLRLDEDGPRMHSQENVEIGAELFAEYIDWRMEHPSDDLMTEMIAAEFEDETGTTRTLRRDEILVYLTLIAGAGNETTTRLIGWTAKLLSEHPEQLRQVAEDRTLIPKVIEEALRYEAPSPVQARYVARDVEYYGQTVPEGSVMLLINGSANRDERRFPDGDRFDIHRDQGNHLSFGYGLHFCLGAALARLEGRVALDEILERWSHWEVDWEHAVQAHTSTVRGWEQLPITVRAVSSS